MRLSGLIIFQKREKINVATSPLVLFSLFWNLSSWRSGAKSSVIPVMIAVPNICRTLSFTGHSSNHLPRIHFHNEKRSNYVTFLFYNKCDGTCYRSGFPGSRLWDGECVYRRLIRDLSWDQHLGEIKEAGWARGRSWVVMLLQHRPHVIP